MVTKSGELEGFSATSSEGKDFSSFIGIPYAALTKRFSVAEPVEPWKRILKATEYGPGCRQRDMLTR